MVARASDRWVQEAPYGPPGTNACQTTRLGQDRPERPSADDDDLLYVIVDRLGWGLIVLAGLMAVGYIVGFSFGCGFRCAFSL